MSWSKNSAAAALESMQSTEPTSDFILHADPTTKAIAMTSTLVSPTATPAADLLRHRHFPVVVIGGGQAGLSMSYCLKKKNITHLVIEKNCIGHAWRNERWDSFCLVTPNWQCTLPGFTYSGNDPAGFMLKDDIVAYLQGYAASFAPPIVENVAVESVARNALGQLDVRTSHGAVTADHVVVAVGGYHIPIVPALAAKLPAHIAQIQSGDYRNPHSLSDGAVLIVGTGQSGCQLAEDLHLAGRKVHLCVGDAPRVARRYRGKDVVDWLDQMKYYDLPVDQHPLGKGVREKTNHYVTGRDGGRDIDLRQFALEGMQLYGRLENIDGGVAQFDNKLKTYLDNADAASENIKNSIDKFIAQQNLDAPAEARYQPVWQPPANAPSSLNLATSQITTVIWCVGFRTDFSWIDLPVFDQRGYPQHDRGVTTDPALSFLGLPWQYSWGSGRFSGVGRDADFLAAHIDAQFSAGVGRAEDVAA